MPAGRYRSQGGGDRRLRLAANGDQSCHGRPAGRCRRLPPRPAGPLRRRETVAEIPHSKLSRRRRRALCQQTARISHSKAFSEIIGSAISGRHITISACQCRVVKHGRHAMPRKRSIRVDLSNRHALARTCYRYVHAVC